MQNMNNASKSPVIRVSRKDAAQLREKFAQRREDDEVEEKVEAILVFEREKRIPKGEKMRREIIDDSFSKGARRGARSPQSSCFDTSLIAKRLGGATRRVA